MSLGEKGQARQSGAQVALERLCARPATHRPTYASVGARRKPSAPAMLRRVGPCAASQRAHTQEKTGEREGDVRREHEQHADERARVVGQARVEERAAADPEDDDHALRDAEQGRLELVEAHARNNECREVRDTAVLRGGGRG